MPYSFEEYSQYWYRFGLLFDDTKPFPKLILTYHQLALRDLFLWNFSQNKILKKIYLKMSSAKYAIAFMP